MDEEDSPKINITSMEGSRMNSIIFAERTASNLIVASPNQKRLLTSK